MMGAAKRRGAGALLWVALLGSVTLKPTGGNTGGGSPCRRRRQIPAADREAGRRHSASLRTWWRLFPYGSPLLRNAEFRRLQE